ncbi:PTS lactose transporter subunit IIC [Sphingomonas sp. Leaf407]|uniref:PTS sugar transporter subunit IIA n=1 Tax=unclassified Sphingomonas TaxID=196159 RepID=UPI0006FBA3D5|nr:MULTISPECIES: PTS sugar transporter subunit IIA [unclassified Sphingomonas]KQN35771.1 PTS lactose transporter subunit IIC [Sphingomonas sp. Leaf42]KQT26639.1 PTS lactose transporter subunit IIC [Sphingomonas sp. Leaf407]
MYDFHDLIGPKSVLADVSASTRKGLFAHLGTVAGPLCALDARVVADLLADRERLGSTAFGGGIAIPHIRVETLDRVVAVFLRLARPLDFGAVDDLPVDLVFALFSPVHAGSEHLKALARVSRSLRDAAFRAKLRGAGSSDALYALLSGVEARDAA